MPQSWGYRAIGETARTAVIRAEALIERLLALAQTAGPLHLESLNLAGVVEEALSQVEAEAERAGIAVERRLSDCVLIADRALIANMVLNLLQNAARQTRPAAG